jgi:hypothetical protein
MITKSKVKTFTVAYPYGYSERAETLTQAEDKLRSNSDTGVIEADPKEVGRYQEYRVGSYGEGWYFAGTIS